MTPTETTPKPKNQQKWAWIWFGYTGFLFLDPIFEPSRALWTGTIAVFLLFVVVMWGYIRATDAGLPLRFWMIGLTFVLGLCTFPWNQGGSTFFIYAAAFLPFAIASIPRVLALFFVESLIILAEGWICHSLHGAFHVSWSNTIIAIFLLVIIGGGNCFFAEQRRAECKLREAQDENVALAAVAERERIARDLHDVLGHTLSVIVLKAELAGRLLNSETAHDPQRAAAEIADVERTARTALADVREAIGGYRARGLAAEIEAARHTLDAAGVTLVAESNPSVTAALSATEETALALALREAVTNIVRHASASTCHLRFISEHGTRRLIVEDNGPTVLVREGNGLRGMRQRIEKIGGQLRLECGNGTRLSIDLPHRTEPATS